MGNKSEDYQLVKESLQDMSTELKSLDADDVKITNLCGENIFSYFHDKYYDYKLKAKSQNVLNGDNEKSNSRNENILILQSMIKELDDEIKKIDDKHCNFLRFLSMKIFLQLLFAKSYEDINNLDILEKVMTEAKLYLCEPQVVYSAFMVMNFIASIKQKKRNSTDLLKAKEILENCQAIYKIMSSLNEDNRYYTDKELFSQEKEMPFSHEATMKYEKLVITNLLLLGSVYQKLNEHYKDIFCYHTAFKRMLNKGLVSPYKWIDFTTRLACVFIDDNNFKDARHHLAAATHVHEILENKNSTIGDSIKKDLIRNNSSHLALAWVRYCILLFEKSKDEDRKKFAILFKNGYTNESNLSARASYTPNDENEYDKSVITDEKVSQNANFVESINNEIVDEFSEVLNESCMVFGNFFHDIMRNHSEDSFSPKDSLVDKSKHKAENKHKNVKNMDRKTDVFSAGIKELNTIQEDTEITEDDLRKEGKRDAVCTINDKTENETENLESEIEENNLEEETQIETEILVLDEKDEIDENNLTFTSLGYLPLEHTVPKDIIQSPDEAKCLFKFAYSWSRQAQTYHPRNTDYFSYINVILNMVSLHRLCAYFQGRDNLEYRISLEQTRESLLEHLVTELNEVQPESHLHVRLYQEMALLNIDLAMLNMCNIPNISADKTYKLCALKEVQLHINHVYIVGDMIEKSSKLFSKEDMDKKDCEEKDCEDCEDFWIITSCDNPETNE